MGRWPLFLVGVLLASSALPQKEPTAGQLLEAILREPLSTTNAAVKSYQAEVQTSGMRVVFRYAKPHRTAVWVADPQDGTPVLVATEGHLAVYDILGSTILLFTNQYPRVKFSSKFSPEPGKSAVTFDFGLEGNPQSAEGSVQFPREVAASHLQGDLRPLGGGKFSFKGSELRQEPRSGRGTTLTYEAVADWPPGPLPYRSLEFQAESVFRMAVKSVNEPIPESSFRFPLEALTRSGLPTRRVPFEISRDLGQMIVLVMANLGIRQALALEDREKRKEAIREICKNFNGANTAKEIDRLYGDPAAAEQMFSKMTPEQWESTRVQFYPDLPREEFERRNQDPVFRRDLAKWFVEWMSKPVETDTGTGLTPREMLKSMTAGFVVAAEQVETLDLEALRDRDQAHASQIRQVFAMEAVSGE